MLTPDQIRAVVETATLAPSVHNSQPWRFTCDGTRVDVHADPARALPRQDPDGRELLISCGAASLLAELAVRGLGRSCTVEVLPDPLDPHLVARVVVGDESRPSAQDERLLVAVPRRHTDRGPYADEPVPVELLQRLGDLAAQESTWVQVLTTADVLELAVLQAHAQQALLADAQALQERAAWGRTGAGPDGMPAALVPGWAAGSATSAPVRVGPDSVLDVVLVLGTGDDDRASWVRAGRALARVLLEATASGLVVAPATLALEMPTVRRALTATLGLRGAPQMVLRTGYPSGLALPPTGRRPVAEVLLTPAQA
jgi:Nitroreductase family